MGKVSVLQDFWQKCQNCAMSRLRPQASINKKSDLDMAYEKILQALHVTMPLVCHHRKISDVLLGRVMTMTDDTWVYCTLHRSTVHQELVKLVIIHFLNDWCTMINRHLTGKVNHLKTQPMFREANQRYEKTRKRPKKGSNKYDLSMTMRETFIEKLHEFATKFFVFSLRALPECAKKSIAVSILVY